MSDMAAHGRQSSHQGRDESLFLPSFCAIRMVFAVILVAQILSFLLVLASPNSGIDVWARLGLVSFFVQWIALSSAAVLCMARPLLSRFSNVAAALVSYLLLLLVTAIFSEIGFLVLYREPMLSPPAGDHFRFLLRNMTISALISVVALRYFYMQHQWKEQVRAEARARIQALQSRIRPHFLFNSLNTIASLTAISAEQAEEAVEDLAELFRMTMHDSEGRVSLAREIEIARRYLRMESLRLGERLRIEWELEDIPDVEVPALILQPLLENAIYHGIEPLPDGGYIKVNIGRQGRQLKMEVENPVPAGTGYIHHRGNRLAHKNIRERLRLAFGRAARLVIESGESLYRVTVRLPLEPVL
jgi:two-component system sensor histidine kinase AlgZ